MTEIPFHPLTGRRRDVDASEMRTYSIRTSGSNAMVGLFGKTRKHENGTDKSHNGIDFTCRISTPVFAAHEGTVRRVGYQTDRNGQQENEGFGSRVYIDGEYGSVRTIYAHLCGQLVKLNQRVWPGDLIGWIGRSGNVSSLIPTHLHWEVHEEGDPVDPLIWLYGPRRAEIIIAETIARTTGETL